jgi:hypothetical protein
VNANQKRTARGLAVLGIGGLLLAAGALVLELLAVQSGGNATISEALWRVWADQPWIVLVATHSVAGPAWWLFGHFTGQSRVVYDAIRAGVDLDAALDLAIEARAAYRLQKRQGNERDPLTVFLSPEFVKALDGPEVKA